MSVITLTKENFIQEAQNASLPVLVDFWAPWCGYCRMIAPVLDQVATAYEGKLIIGKVNTDEQQALAEQYQIMTLPSLLLFYNGKVVGPIVGAQSRHQIETWLKENGAL